jgi:hypothetical protein
MAQCLNCKKTLSCGCQKRATSDGKSACTSCITAYEAKKTQSIVKPLLVQSNQINK